MPGNFFDSNVLLYIASGETAKADRAEELLRAGGTICVQVLNEISHVGRRKMRLSWEELRPFLALIRGLVTVEPMTIDTHQAGIALAERYRLSVYDGMIAAAALLADCDCLWSEDLQHGMVIDRHLRVVDPFRTG